MSIYPRKTPKKLDKCKFCNTEIWWGWNFRAKRTEVMEVHNSVPKRVIHRCLPTKKRSKEDIVPGECKYCGSTAIVFVKQSTGRMQATETYGLPHVCKEFEEAKEAKKAAKRKQYAKLKEWANSYKEGYCCRSCKGNRFRRYAKKKGYRYELCRACKGIGHFTESNKKLFLWEQRKKLWPYQPWMRWNKS